MTEPLRRIAYLDMDAFYASAELLPVDFDQYRHYSRLLKAEILKIAPVMEDRGIDEVYIDLSEVPGGQEAVVSARLTLREPGRPAQLSLLPA